MNRQERQDWREWKQYCKDVDDLSAYIIFGTPDTTTMTAADNNDISLAKLAIPKPNRRIYTFYARNWHEASRLYNKMYDDGILPFWGQ